MSLEAELGIGETVNWRDDWESVGSHNEDIYESRLWRKWPKTETMEEEQAVGICVCLVGLSRSDLARLTLL